MLGWVCNKKGEIIMTLTIGYGRPQTDLPGALSAGLQIGQRGRQMQLDEQERQRQAMRFGLEQEYKQDVLALGERGETRLQAKQDFTLGEEFTEEKRQFTQSYQQAARVLALNRDKMEASITMAVGQKGAAQNVLLRELEQSESKDKRVPGKWEFSKADAQSKMDGMDEQLAEQVASITKQHEDTTSGLRTAVQRDIERMQELAKVETERVQYEDDIKMIELAFSFADANAGDPVAQGKRVESMKQSTNPVVQRFAQFAESVGSTSNTPDGVVRDMVNALPLEEQERYAWMMVNKAFGPLVMTEEKIDKLAIELAKAVGEVMNPDEFGPLVTMRSHYDDNEREGTVDDFKEYLKDTLVYSTNAFDQIRIARAYVKEGEIPTKRKQEKDVKTETKKPETKKETSQPKDRKDFITTLKAIEDEAEARAYFKKWLNKWQNK